MIFHSKKGFSLIEIVISIGLFVLFALGIYGSLTFVFKIVYQSRLRILETAVLNEQLEIARNLPFSDVGIVNGSPAGVLEYMVTTSKNNLPFTITRTIRNIDDPFDGTIDGTPIDTAPADYKLVEMEITCGTYCNQRVPLSLMTYISPKKLEGDPTHGALFVQVADSQAKPVVGANVQIVATSTNPTYNFSDVTDNDGMLRVVDLPAANNAYQITVSKSGYTTDGTMSPTPAIPNPTKPSASVPAQDVNKRSFSIDYISSITLSTINSVCSAVPSVGVNFLGTKVLGTNPDVLKVNQNIITNGSGQYNFPNLEWDAYGFKVSGYDVKGSIPGMPINLIAGTDQGVRLVLGANTVNSIVVYVVDSITNQPLSNATVNLSGADYNQTKSTGVGFVGQTDWSGGAGQLVFSNATKYWTDDGKMDVLSSVGDIKLQKVGQNYVSNGYLESSIFNLETSVDFVNLIWSPLAQPIEVGENSVRFQIATANTSTPEAWNYLGPDGTAGTYYNEQNNSINNIHSGDQYWRYKLFLQTASATNTPVISDVELTYTNSCTPPGQAYFGGLVAQDYTVTVTRTGYQNYTSAISASGDLIQGVRMVAQ